MKRRTIMLALLAVGVLAGVGWYFSAPMKYTAKLRGDQTLVLERVAYGKTNHYMYGGILANLALRHLPVMAVKLFPNAGKVIRSTEEDEFSCWLTVRDGKGGFGSLPGLRMELIDEHGCVMGRATDHLKSKLSPWWFHFSSFPRRQRDFRVRISDLQGALLAEWLVRNPAPRAFAEWPPERLPAVRTNGARTFSLNGFEPHPNYPYPHFTPQFSFKKEGKATLDSSYVGSTWRDATGNWVAEDNRLCPRETAWKLVSRFSVSAAGAVFQAPLMPRGTFTPLDGSQSIHGVTIDLVAIANTGTTTYSNGVPVLARTNFAGTRTTKRTTTRTPRAEITQLSVNAPHLAVRVHGLTADQKLALIVADPEGRVYDATPLPHEAGLDFFVLNLPRNITGATMRFLVQQTYEAEYWVKPPTNLPP